MVSDYEILVLELSLTREFLKIDRHVILLTNMTYSNWWRELQKRRRHILVPSNRVAPCGCLSERVARGNWTMLYEANDPN